MKAQIQLGIGVRATVAMLCSMGFVTLHNVFQIFAMLSRQSAGSKIGGLTFQFGINLQNGEELFQRRFEDHCTLARPGG